MNGYRLATVLILTCIAHGAAAQTNPAPRDEASCLAGIRMNDARRAYIDEWVQINRFRAPSTAGESDADWTARHRAATACGRRDIWVQEDQAENWRRQVIALPDERQRQLWAEFNSETERRRTEPTAPGPNGQPAKDAITTVWLRLQARWRDEDAAKLATAPPAQPAPPAPPGRVGPCVQRDAQGRDRCMAPVWYVMNDRGCQRVDTLIGDAHNRIRTPLDFKSFARQEGIEVTLRNLPGPGQMVEAVAVGSSSMLVFAPNFLSCSVNFNVLMRQAKGLESVDLAPQPPPAWVAALGAP